jgi:hypothetical protein
MFHRLNDVEMTGDGEDSGDPFRDDDAFEKQMCLAHKSEKTTVRDSVTDSPSQSKTDQLEGGLLEKPIPYISNDNFSQSESWSNFEYNDRNSCSNFERFVIKVEESLSDLRFPTIFHFHTRCLHSCLLYCSWRDVDR